MLISVLCLIKHVLILTKKNKNFRTKNCIYKKKYFKYIYNKNTFFKYGFSIITFH